MSKAIIRTFTGRMIDLENPQADDIDARDIAHHLALLNRFVGATDEPYSVAEHCVIGSEIIRGEFALHFLLHDAHEAYLGDVSRILKRVMGGAYQELAAKFDQVIALKFDVPNLDCRSGNSIERWEVDRIDQLMLDVEKDRLMGVRMRAGSWARRNPEAQQIYARLGRREGNPELRFLQRLDELGRR